MEAARNDFDRIFADAINQSVTSVDPARPKAGVFVAERLRLADPLVPVALDIRNESVDALEGLAILELPPDIVAPGLLIPCDVPGCRYWMTGLPPMDMGARVRGLPSALSSFVEPMEAAPPAGDQPLVVR